MKTHSVYCTSITFFTWRLEFLNIAAKNQRVPDFVFLAHAVDLSSAMHAPFAIRSMAALPYYTRIYMLPLLPICFAIMLVMWAKSKSFLSSCYNLRDRLHQTWLVPRFGFQVRKSYMYIYQALSAELEILQALTLLLLKVENCCSISCHLLQKASIIT